MSKPDDLKAIVSLSLEQQDANIRAIQEELSQPERERTPEEEAKYQAMVLRFFPVSPLDSDITIH